MNALHPPHPSLREVQEAMAARILAAPSPSPNDDAKLESWLPAERLHIYRGGYPARIRDSLAETFAAVAHLVGDEAFAALADRYAASVPLTSYNLNDAGAQLPAFLRDDRSSDDRPFLPDLAELEWRVAKAFHAAERPALDPRTLPWTVEDWANAVLRFQPSVAVLASAWPLLDLWTARDIARDANDIELHGCPEHVVVRRAGLIVRCESVSSHEAFALQLLLDGHHLAESMERLEADGHDPSAVLAWFSRWTNAGMIADAVAHPSP